MSWTQADIDAVKRKMAACKQPLQARQSATIANFATVRPTAKASRRTMHKSGEMNKTETAYAAYLQSHKNAGEIADYRFECIKLRLADKTFYTPDFMVLLPDGAFEMHEVKGYWEEDARVKIKVAAAQYPFKFIAVKKIKGGWQTEEF